MFGMSIVSTKRLKELEKSDRQIQTIHQIYRWFSGWRDLDIIWDYVFDESYLGGISSARSKYAEARKTDEYGKPVDQPTEGASK